MLGTGKKTTTAIITALFLLLGIIGVRDVLSATCEEGTSRPPFLGTRVVTPNALLMLDNSASMYDLAYIQDLKLCSDETYDNTRTDLAGYFDNDTWYNYDLIDEQFEPQADEATALAVCSVATGDVYTGTGADTNEFVCVTMDNTGPAITAFAATGHFLNWAATSKMDIQKWILTGGKYDDINSQLVMESRGCADGKMIKQVGLTDSGGDPYKLALGVLGDDDDLTRIEIYEITEDGVDPDAKCQATVNYLVSIEDPNDFNQGVFKQLLDACLGDPPNNSAEGNSNAAFNHVVHACWYDIKQGTWPPGAGTVNSMKNACEKVYSNMFDLLVPSEYQWDIEKSDSGYGCFGNPARQTGYVGRCWSPGAAAAPLIPYNDEENGQTLIADYGMGQELESTAYVSDQVAMSTETSLQPIEESRFRLLDALRNFIAAKGNRSTARASVWQAFWDFLVARAEAAPVVVGDPFPRTGWNTSTASNEWAGQSYRSKTEGDIAYWRQAIGVDGQYSVRVWSACEAKAGDRDPAATYTVVADTGSVSYDVNQNLVADGGVCGTWYQLGTTHHFNAADGAEVQVEVTDASYYTNADAVEFNLVSIDTTTSTSTTSTSSTTTSTSTSSTTTSSSSSSTSSTSTSTTSSTSTTTTTIPYTWTSDGLWHLVPRGEAPPPRDAAGGDKWYYGQDGVKNFDTGLRNWGTLYSPTYTINPGGTLEFLSWAEAENSGCCSNDPASFCWDSRWVDISIDNGNSWVRIHCNNAYVAADPLNRMSKWILITVDISAYAGQNAIFKFEFDTLDAVGNFFEGWYLDDIKIGGVAVTTTTSTSTTSTTTTSTSSTSTTSSSTTSSTSTSTTTTSSTTSTTTLTLPPDAGWFAPPGQTDSDGDGDVDSDDCVDEAMKDFCGAIDMPPVIDPSDVVTGTGGSFSGMPGFLAMMGAEAQIGEPLLSMKGHVQWTSADDPSGLIQKYDQSIRIGLMSFNDKGDATECSSLAIGCTTGAEEDGATINVPVDTWNSTLWGFNHTAVLVWTINQTKAATWTPLSEAIHTGIGYYGERDTYVDSGGITQDYRINPQAQLFWGDYNVVPYAPGWAEDVDYYEGATVRVGNTYYQTMDGGVSACAPAPAACAGPPDDVGITDWVDVTASVDSDLSGIAAYDGNNFDYDPGDVVLYNNEYYVTATDANSNSASGDIADDVNITDWTRVRGPILAECQSNNIIIITEGASTADIHPTMIDYSALLTENGVAAQTDDDIDGCDALLGTTLFDDYAYYAKEGTDVYAMEPFGSAASDQKSNISTYIVRTGSPREGLAGECDPDELLVNAANQGSDLGQLYEGSTPSELYAALDALFASILTKTSSGSAASVISASRGGEGALYQAIFWPDKLRGFDALAEPEYTKWTGEVHSFLVDSEGLLYLDNYPPADPAGNGALDPWEDTNSDGTIDSGDQPVVIFYDSENELTLACYGTIVYTDGIGEVEFFDADGDCLNTTTYALDEVSYLWSTSDWLNSSKVDGGALYDITENRPLDTFDTPYEFDWSVSDSKNMRFIFTWNDLDNDGVVEGADEIGAVGSEVLPFVNNLGQASGWITDAAEVSGGRLPVSNDLGIDPAAADAELKVNRIINWIRGLDQDGLAAGDVDPASGLTATVDHAAMRSRQAAGDLDSNGQIDSSDTDGDLIDDTFELVTWKLGDVIHSTPLSVATPAENYHQLYRDFSYSEFLVRYDNRRHMIYFGANDGMLHAVNGGFYDEDLNNDKIKDTSRFCLTQACEVIADVEQNTANEPELGAELWAYVPYNLLPHLSCLTDDGYGTGSTDHKYFVDLRPRIFDVQIFREEDECDPDFYAPVNELAFLEEECVHPNGWGTILVGGMRFGGSPVSFWDDANSDGIAQVGEFSGDLRQFISSYFIFDITNPEKLPVLLAEFTRVLSDVDSDGIIEDTDGDGFPDESTVANLGYSTVISTLVPMKSFAEDLDGDTVIDDGEDKDCDNALDDEINSWSLILGSGPTEVDGTSGQAARVAAIPLERFVVTKPVAPAAADPAVDPLKHMRIPAALPLASGAVADVEDSGFGTYTLGYGSSFVSDIITVDMQTNRDYMADVIYFGTISGDWSPTGWSGKMHRIVTREEISNATNGIPGDIVGCDTPKQVFNEAINWDPELLIDVGQPITTAPTVGTDGVDFWVYFGTGRFFHQDDKTDDSSNATQSYYGIREPVDADCDLNWEEVWNNRTDPTCVTDARCPDGDFGDYRGTRGLMHVDTIGVLSAESVNQADTIYCKDLAVLDDNGTDNANCTAASTPYGCCTGVGTGTCETDDTLDISDKSCQSLTDLYDNYNIYESPGSDPDYTYMNLINYISGTDVGCSGLGTMGLDGWYRNFEEERERNLGQASLLGGLLSYTSYRPFVNVCKSEGLGYLYGLYYQTGVPWYSDVFGTVDADADPRTANPERMDLGEGLSTTPNIHVGSEEGGKAFIQTSVGKIKEIPQPNLPNKHVKSGRIKWRDIDM
ncbi:hypothetical protein ACFLYW_01835 [Thermodesulfobacteriota bacterium]